MRVGDLTVNDDGIWKVIKICGQDDFISSLILSKDAFVQAYDKWIRPRGHWEKYVEQRQIDPMGNWVYESYWKCTECGEKIKPQFSSNKNYCPSCGANNRED